MSADVITGPQFEAIKQRQQKMWASGDFSAVAAHIHPVSERLCDAADLVAGARVLDVAPGAGHAGTGAAGRACDVGGAASVPARMCTALGAGQGESPAPA